VSLLIGQVTSPAAKRIDLTKGPEKPLGIAESRFFYRHALACDAMKEKRKSTQSTRGAMPEEIPAALNRQQCRPEAGSNTGGGTKSAAMSATKEEM
jgi:hypothetical protein